MKFGAMMSGRTRNRGAALPAAISTVAACALRPNSMSDSLSPSTTVEAGLNFSSEAARVINPKAGLRHRQCASGVCGQQ